MILVLSRKIGESIEIKLPDGQTIQVMLTRIASGERVKLGVIAPKEFRVCRMEVANVQRRD